MNATFSSTVRSAQLPATGGHVADVRLEPVDASVVCARTSPTMTSSSVVLPAPSPPTMAVIRSRWGFDCDVIQGENMPAMNTDVAHAHAATLPASVRGCAGSAGRLP